MGPAEHAVDALNAVITIQRLISTEHPSLSVAHLYR